MKKTLAMLLALVMVFSLVLACATPAAGTDTGTEQKSAETATEAPKEEETAEEPAAEEPAAEEPAAEEPAAEEPAAEEPAAEEPAAEEPAAEETAEAAEFKATLGFANSDWSAQEWGENAFTTVKGDGTYTVSWDGAASDALVFVVDIAGANAALAEKGKTYLISDVKVTADGAEIALDPAKVVTGDIEGNGNFRIEIYNEYGSTKADPGIDPAAVKFEKNLSVTFTVKEASKYAATAKLGFANSDWSAQEWGDNANVLVDGSGTYSVSWDGAASDAYVFVVDIVGADALMKADGLSYKLTDLKVEADGAEVPVDLTKVLTGDIEENGNFRIEIYNEYGNTKADPGIDPAAVKFEKNLTVTFAVEAESKYAAQAKLGFANSDWSAQEWGDIANTVVGGSGTYSVSWDGAASDALVFVVDVVGADALLKEDGFAYQLTGLKVEADGAEIPVDISKVVTGDIEENGNFRIEIYNEYGNTKTDPGIDPAAVKFEKNLTVTFTLETVESAGELNAEFAATLGFANADWSAQEWGENANTTVTGEGTYSLSWDGAASDALVFIIDMAGAQKALAAHNLTFTVTDLKVEADGAELAVDASKVLSGDLEENGNFRIEIYNEYGNTKADPAIDPAAVKFEKNLTVTFTLAYAPFEGSYEEASTGPAFDENGTYNAYLLLQTPNWTFRDAWNSANGLDSEYWGNFLYGNETKEKYGVVTDAVIAGNGTYTVSVTDFGTVFADDFATAGQEYFNIIGISTDLPVCDAVKITNVELVVDGKVRHKYDEAFLNPDSTDYIHVLIQNKWNSDVAEISYYPAPTTSLEINFTVSGFAYDKTN